MTAAFAPAARALLTFCAKESVPRLIRAMLLLTAGGKLVGKPRPQSNAVAVIPAVIPEKVTRLAEMRLVPCATSPVGLGRLAESRLVGTVERMFTPGAARS